MLEIMGVLMGGAVRGWFPWTYLTSRGGGRGGPGRAYVVGAKDGFDPPDYLVFIFRKRPLFDMIVGGGLRALYTQVHGKAPADSLVFLMFRMPLFFEYEGGVCFRCSICRTYSIYACNFMFLAGSAMAFYFLFCVFFAG